MKTFKSSDGLALAYRDEGDGHPVLCLAGLTRNSRDFDYLAPHLGGCRLIRPDYRGRGRSDFDSDPMNYSVPVEARDALELLDHLGIGSVTAIGTSRGGMVSMFIAATAKDRLNGVVLNDIGPVLDPEGLERIREYVGVDPCHGSMEEAAAATRDSAIGFAGVPDARWMSEAERRFKQTPDGPRLDYDPRLRVAFDKALEGPLPDMWPFYRALEGLPVALIRGENSDLLSQATAEKMRAALPGLIFAEVPRTGHAPFLDEPESIAAISAILTAADGAS